MSANRFKRQLSGAVESSEAKRVRVASNCFATFPIEMLWHVLHFLALHQWLAFRLTCRAYYRLGELPRCNSITIKLWQTTPCQAVTQIWNWNSIVRMVLVTNTFWTMKCIQNLTAAYNVRELVLQGSSRVRRIKGGYRKHSHSRPGEGCGTLRKLKTLIVRNYEDYNFHFDSWSELCSNVKHLILENVRASEGGCDRPWKILKTVTCRAVKINNRHPLYATHIAAQHWIFLGETWGSISYKMAFTKHKPLSFTFADCNMEDKVTKLAMKYCGTDKLVCTNIQEFNIIKQKIMSKLDSHIYGHLLEF
eukprot:TRINITY_DN531_c0_g1_i1.p1 TRINITY_DN531_c0_g1~~TRINITY_DN531_c0_g1_i1.p1  ORF type:complete len:306 (-),score=-11.56 TRINITY_DN531_c0_g1_i1:36-953(-)